MGRRWGLGKCSPPAGSWCARSRSSRPRSACSAARSRPTGRARASSHAQASLAAWAADVAVGALAAGVLNGASNVLNQSLRPADRPDQQAGSRPLPSGRISVRAALVLSVVLYAASLAAAATINASVFAMFALGALATVDLQRAARCAPSASAGGPT